jgi:hypothetical protein
MSTINILILGVGLIIICLLVHVPFYFWSKYKKKAKEPDLHRPLFKAISTIDLWAVAIAVTFWIIFNIYGKLWPESAIGLGMKTPFVPTFLFLFLSITSSLIVKKITKKWQHDDTHKSTN